MSSAWSRGRIRKWRGHVAFPSECNKEYVTRELRAMTWYFEFLLLLHSPALYLIETRGEADLPAISADLNFAWKVIWNFWEKCNFASDEFISKHVISGREREKKKKYLVGECKGKKTSRSRKYKSLLTPAVDLTDVYTYVTCEISFINIFKQSYRKACGQRAIVARYAESLYTFIARIFSYASGISNILTLFTMDV